MTTPLGARGGRRRAGNSARFSPTRTWVPRRYVALGTDGFGRSDTREALRRFFEVDRGSIVVAALKALADVERIAPSVVVDAVKRFRIDTECRNPWDA